MVAYLDQETIDFVGSSHYLKDLDHGRDDFDCSTDTIDWWTQSHHHFPSALLHLHE